MPINEPRIWTNKPKWTKGKEIKREKGMVHFKLKHSTIIVPEKDVEDYIKRTNKVR